MGEGIKDPLFFQLAEQLEAFCAKVDEKIEKEQQQLKACRKKTELEAKLAHEMKKNSELTELLAELSRRGGELERMCAVFESKKSIAERDLNRLENAKENYQVAKDLTGIRFNFGAPPNIAKGYIKNPARKILQPFTLDMQSEDTEVLWTLMQCGDKENTPHN